VKIPSWQFEEADQHGQAFADPRVAEAYDAKHRTFRDINNEHAMIVAGLEIGSEHTVADFG
jgi:hypothetical protein